MASVPPAWERQVMAVAAAGFLANAALRLTAEKHYAYVLARPETRQCMNGKQLHELVRHPP
jgi:hypothetical protein